jgi:hypothetical protein
MKAFRITILAAILSVLMTGMAPAQSNLFGTVTNLLGGGSGATGSSEVADGLREALKVGTERVVGQVGKADGYLGDPAIHIPLPDTLRQVQSTLKRFGLSGMADDLEQRINRAAEEAAPAAKRIFWDAISAMTLDDAMDIYNGPKDSATQYFRSKMSAPLADSVRPVVDSKLSEVGAVASYDALMADYKALPFVPDIKADLTKHAVDGALAGLFHYLAKEEAAIRDNPAARTTDLLRRVFSQ